VNHDDKMRKVAYDSGARKAAGSLPATTMGGSVVRHHAVKSAVRGLALAYTIAY
jgi:hypothetical protein